MAPHPLDPLSEQEFRDTVAILRRERAISNSWRFASIEMQEPAKAVVKAWTAGSSVPRQAKAVLWNKADNTTYEAVLDLTADGVASWTHMPGVTPNFTVDEYHECDEAMRADPDVIEKLKGRGIADMSLVLFDVWSYGHAVMPEQYRDRRAGWCDVWLRETPNGNPYAHPVSGLKVIVDMNTMEVLEIEDHHDYGFADVDGEYVPELRAQSNAARSNGDDLVLDELKPLEITQPEGVSFSLDGNELKWQNWTMRLGFNYREGMTLHQVTFDDQGTTRDIAYRMSFAEMIVPYRDPSFDHYRRTAFDIGEWGLGFMTTSLELGCDCLGEITYVDAVLHDSHGEPETIKQAICLHEEDAAVLWKHVDERSGAEVRRMRRMVVSCHATVANYEYLIYWRFYTDGNIECEVRATGIMVTTPLPPGEANTPNGTLVDNSTYAPLHQHFLVARLDMDIDGQDNTVVEVDSYAPPISAENPHGLAVLTQQTPITSENDSARDFNWNTQRAWKISNPAKTNKIGTNTAYKLVPSASLPSMLDESSPIYQRSPVIGHTLWVTEHNETERFPAGDYPTQSAGNAGVAEWIKDDANLVDADVVLWYVFGIHHVTRVEDWPIMPSDTVSWWLKPFGFFDQNPSINAARSSGGNHCSPA